MPLITVVTEVGGRGNIEGVDVDKEGTEIDEMRHICLMYCIIVYASTILPHCNCTAEKNELL